MDQKTKAYYLYCGIKSGWHEKSLKDFTNDPTTLRKVKKYLSNYREASKEGIGLYLWGANGTGKSHLMNCSFKVLIDEGVSVRIYSMDEIVDRFTSSWYSDSVKEEFNSTLRNVAFLGIDEFGKNLSKDGEPAYLPDLVKRAIESIIRFRVQMKRPIWIASNTDPSNVKVVFSEDVASLLREAVIPYCVSGGDYREKIFEINSDKF